MDLPIVTQANIESMSLRCNSCLALLWTNMPERKTVTPLKVVTECFVINSVIKLATNHEKCRNCHGYGYEAILRSFWNTYYNARGIKESYDCLKLVEAVDFIIPYVPPSQLKQEFSEYFRTIAPEANRITFRYSIGYKIMQLLALQSSKDMYCSKIKILVQTLGLNYLNCNSIEMLDHFLPLCENLKVLNLTSRQSNDDTLLMIGKHCDNLEELRNIVMERYSLEGLKKMLYSDPEYTTKRRISESLKIVSSNEKKAPVTNWNLMSENEKIETSDKWYELFQCCPNVFTKGYFHIEEILQLIHNKHNYVHPTITLLCFDKPEKEYLDLMSTLYPNVTNVEFFETTEHTQNLSKFTNITSLIVKSMYSNIEPFLTSQGKVLQKLDLKCVDDDFTIDLNQLASKCPNLITLTILAPSFSLQNHGATFKCLEKLNQQISDVENPNLQWSLDLNELIRTCPNLVSLLSVAPSYTFERRPQSFRSLETLSLHIDIHIILDQDADTQWFAYFLASLNNLKMLDIGLSLANRITAQWLNNLISYGSFQNLEYLRIFGYPRLDVNDWKTFTYSCPKLKKFNLISYHFGDIPRSEWTDFKAEVEAQNYDLHLSYRT